MAEDKQHGGDQTDVVVPITVDEALEVLKGKADGDE